MSEKIKKSHKLWLVLVVLLIILLLLYNSASITVKKENQHRTFIAVSLKNSIERYFSEHQQYPENVLKIDLQYKETIQEFLQAGILEYEKDSYSGEGFTLICRYSRMQIAGRSTQALSQHGLQYSSDIKKIPLPYKHPPIVEKNGFYQANFVKGILATEK